MQKDDYNFIYNDGDFQIREEEVVTEATDFQSRSLEGPNKYYQVDKNYKHIASFKEKKEALLYVGWRNTRILKESGKELLRND